MTRGQFQTLQARVCIAVAVVSIAFTVAAVAYAVFDFFRGAP